VWKSLRGQFTTSGWGHPRANAHAHFLDTGPDLRLNLNHDPGCEEFFFTRCVMYRIHQGEERVLRPVASTISSHHRGLSHSTRKR
jgi:hypothetical protein